MERASGERANVERVNGERANEWAGKERPSTASGGVSGNGSGRDVATAAERASGAARANARPPIRGEKKSRKIFFRWG